MKQMSAYDIQIN